MTPEAYRGQKGRLVSLGEELGAGGEGAVFSIRGAPGRCAKLHRADRTPERGEKLRAMLASPPSWLARRAIAWPTELLFGDGGYAGFVMPRARGMLELHRLIVPAERLQVAGFLTARDLCLIAAGLARAVRAVHRAGHCVGDLRPQNVLVAPHARRVMLVDTDSFQVRDRESGRVHPSSVVTPEYTAPELFADPARTPRTPATDAFALAVLVHQLLLGGAHPFEGELVVPRPDLERIPARIRRGLCALAPGATEIRAAAGALPVAALHPELRELFARCFGAGHADPAARPAPAAWQKALHRASRNLVPCSACEAHLHDEGLAACPWCERRERTGFDHFPAGQAWQRAVARWPDPRAAPERARRRWLRRHAEGRLRRGVLTPREREWLVKTGAALGLDRATTARVLEEAARPRAPFVVARALFAKANASLSRRRTQAVALRLATAAALLAAVAAGALVSSRPRTFTVAAATRDAALRAVATRDATIGNTRGRGAFLRTSPSTASEKLLLPDGTLVRLTGRKRSGDALAWSEVELESYGRTGWVATKYLVEWR